MQSINDKISEIRTAIRLYVVIDGLARTAAIVAIGIWLVMLIDYLPIRFGFLELPWHPRATGLLIVAAAAAAVFQTQFFGRIRRKLSDENICLLIERHYPEFEDRLLALTLNQAEFSGRHNSLMSKSIQQAADQIDRVKPSALLAPGPLLRAIGGLLIPVATLIVVLLVMPDWAKCGLNRTLLLADQRYARQTVLSSFRFRVVPENEDIANWFPSDSILFSDEASAVLPRNSRLEVMIDALPDQAGRTLKIPRSCRLRYRLQDGRNGIVRFVQFKKESSGRTSFVCRDALLSSLDSPGRFWVHANDATIGPFQFDVVESPSPTEISKQETYPEYLTRSSPIWKSGNKPFVNNEPVPQGTIVNFNIGFNKESLATARIWNHSTSQRIEANPQKLKEGVVSFDWQANQATDIQLAVVDQNGIVSSQPTSLSIPVIQDRPPEINVQLKGIGFSVTPNALIRLNIEGTDEFGIKEGQVQLILNGGSKNGSNAIVKIDKRFPWDREDSREVEIDLLEYRRSGQLEIFPEQLENDLKISLTAQVTDFCPENPPAIGQVYEFDVVSEIRFVQLVEQEEAGFRKRLEDIHNEFESARSTIRAVRDLVNPPSELNQESIQSMQDSGKVYLQRLRLQTQKSAQEIISIANSFNALIEQIINNRLSGNTKQQGLEQDIEGPLRAFATQNLTAFLDEIQQCVAQVAQIQDQRSLSVANERTKAIAKRHNELVVQLDAIIQKMVKYESHAELLDSIRNLMEDQKALSAETRKERERILFDGLFD